MDEPDPKRTSSEILLEVALQFGNTLSLDRLLPLVLERVTTALGAERSLFALLDHQGRVERAVVHNLEWAGPGSPLPVSQGLIERVVDTKDVVIVADAMADNGFKGRHSVQALAVRFMVGIPVHVDGRVGGVICVDSSSARGAKGPGEESLLTALARLVGTAVENARFFEEQQFRMHLLSQMVHDFRVPLSVITMNTDLLSRHLETEDEDVQELVSDVAASVCRMSRMVENTLELARVESGSRETLPAAVDLAVALPRHINMLRVMAQPLGIRLAPVIEPNVPEAWTVIDWVWIVVDNLVFNAIKHAEQASTIRIGLRHREDKGPLEALRRPFDEALSLFRRKHGVAPPIGCGFLEVSVHNEGAPLSREIVPTLFLPFTGTDRSVRAARNTGLGLAIVDQCVRHLGGAVWATSSAGEGTTFSFTVPTVASV